MAEQATARKTALITGASMGEGYAIARHLAQAGFNIALNARVDQMAAAAVQRLKQDLKDSDIKVMMLSGDVTYPYSRDEMMADFYREFRTLDVLVNNDGTGAYRRCDLFNVTPDSWDNNMSINAKGLFFFSQMAAKRMMAVRYPEGEHPYIINVTSIYAELANPHCVEFCVSKAAAAMVTQVLALRLATTPIRVYEVRAGLIENELSRKVNTEYSALTRTGGVPMKRQGSTDDVARAVTALATGALGYTTGEVIRVDGGMHIHG
ncbi:MAG: 3-ketoacyl-ACP reductase, partial [Succinivibrionaceae bacterium]|nr:3-ketoacyl-ACP reductase [Succinivibrionaceae bacterium]